jgi:hypothetical protein
MHLDEEQVQRFLHDELAPPAQQRVQEHLAGCTDCRSRVTAAGREEAGILEILTRLDHPAPRLDVEAVTTRAAARRGSQWARPAAGILLALAAAGVAYAAPGSPLPGLVTRLVERIAPRPAPRPGRPAQSPDTAPAGIAVVPGERFTILFTRELAENQAAVTVTDDANVVVRAHHGSASFTADLDRLSIDDPGDGTVFEIIIPRRAPWVEIRVSGRRVFLKQGSRITPDRRDPAGRYLLQPAAARP